MTKYCFIVIVTTLLALMSCRDIHVREATTALPRHEWPRGYKAIADLDIADSGQHFLYFIVRHTEKFGFTHLPVQIDILDTVKNKKSFLRFRINAPLVTSNGDWSGSNMDDLYYHRIKISLPVLLNKNRCRFAIQHEVSEDPLRNILDVGIAVNKIISGL